MEIVLKRLAVCRHQLIRYYLLKEIQKNGEESYGVCVTYRDEMQNIQNITFSKKQICCLLNMLANGCVTPTTVRDVIEDWLLT